mmetsp:Transcript_105223/g.322552  ORF Transcript_105223/g.322552 Transcript_105223/m.322552 type:complete len:260 (-) Transcript_105223:1212-1991(-)
MAVDLGVPHHLLGPLRQGRPGDPPQGFLRGGRRQRGGRPGGLDAVVALVAEWALPAPEENHVDLALHDGLPIGRDEDAARPDGAGGPPDAVLRPGVHEDPSLVLPRVVLHEPNEVGVTARLLEDVERDLAERRLALVGVQAAELDLVQLVPNALQVFLDPLGGVPRFVVGDGVFPDGLAQVADEGGETMRVEVLAHQLHLELVHRDDGDLLALGALPADPAVLQRVAAVGLEQQQHYARRGQELLDGHHADDVLSVLLF